MEALHKERNELQVGTKARNSYALITTEKPKSFEEQCKSLWCSKESKRKQMLMKLKLSLTLTNFVMLVCSLNK